MRVSNSGSLAILTAILRAELILAEQLGCGSAPRLILEIDIRQRLPVVVGRMQKVRRLAVAIQKAWRVSL
jgi:hypothetical protein